MRADSRREEAGRRPAFGTGLNTCGTATLLLQEFEKATAHYIEGHNDCPQLLMAGGQPTPGPLR